MSNWTPLLDRITKKQRKMFERKMKKMRKRFRRRMKRLVKVTLWVLFAPLGWLIVLCVCALVGMDIRIALRCVDETFTAWSNGNRRMDNDQVEFQEWSEFE